MFLKILVKVITQSKEIKIFGFYLVIIDRKYNRSNDTGHFELIHKGTPVPVPIYVGMDLRVEGKTCKTGRTPHNNTKILAPVSAPPHISLSKIVPANSESDHPQSSGAFTNPEETSSSKTDGLTINDTLSSDSIMDKIDDNSYPSHPSNKSSNHFPITFNSRRHKEPAKKNSNRITVDTLPIHRSKIPDRLSSSNGK